MDDRTNTEGSFAGASPLKLPCDPSDASKSIEWLRERYMKNVRDLIFNDALEEILETDRDGQLTVVPHRVV